MKNEITVCDACKRHVEDGEYLELDGGLDLCDDCQRIVSDVFRSESDVLYENLLYAARGVVRLSDAVVSDQTTEISGGLASELLRLKAKVEVIDKRNSKRKTKTEKEEAIPVHSSEFSDFKTDEQLVWLLSGIVESLSREEFFNKHYPRLSAEITSRRQSFNDAITRLVEKSKNPAYVVGGDVTEKSDHASVLSSSLSSDALVPADMTDLKEGDVVYVRAIVKGKDINNRLTHTIGVDSCETLQTIRDAWKEKLYVIEKKS